jgi:hypothetical protein
VDPVDPDPDADPQQFILLVFWLPMQLPWVLPREQCCLIVLSFIFRVLGFLLLTSGVRAVCPLSLLILFSVLPQSVLE